MAKSYNRYEYETSPKKLEPYYAPNQKKVKTKAKNEKKKVIADCSYAQKILES